MQPTVQNLKDHRVARQDRSEALAWLAAELRWADRLDELEGQRHRDRLSERAAPVAKAG